MPVLFVDLGSFHKVEKVCENVVLIGIHSSGPFEALHLEFLDEEVTAQDTQSIADENIQDKRVPPAFFEVREPVLESEFQEFKEDT
jgi:hypothetical protein